MVDATDALAQPKKRKVAELESTEKGDGSKRDLDKPPQARLSIAERKKLKKAHKKASAPDPPPKPPKQAKRKKQGTTFSPEDPTDQSAASENTFFDPPKQVSRSFVPVQLGSPSKASNQQN
eukprot:6766589-Pyramimonas_sp.AAC.1